MAQKQSQVAGMSAGKGVSTAESNEQQRRWSDDLWRRKEAEANYNRSRAHLNFEIVKGGRVQPIAESLTIGERMDLRMKELGIVDPNKGLPEPKFRTCARFIFGGSRERMLQLAFGEQSVDVEHRNDDSHLVLKEDFINWAKDVYQFLCERYGEDNIVGCYAHLDEKNPHLHVTILPITPDGKLSYKKVFTGDSKFEYRNRMLAFHSELAEVNAKWGLARGSNVHETGARHRSTEEYRRDLARECSSLEQDIDGRKEELSSLNSEIRKAQIKLKGLTTMVENLNKEISSLTEQREDILFEVEYGKLSVVEGNAKLKAIDEALASKNAMLADKQAKLGAAQKELEYLHNRKCDMEEKAEDLSKMLHSIANDLSAQMSVRTKAAAFDETVA